MWLKTVIPVTVIGSSCVAWAFVELPSSSVFGILVAASGTMLALAAATQAWQSSVLDSWLTLYARIVAEVLAGSKEYDQTTYGTGIEILEERAKIVGYLRGACYDILASLIFSISALCLFSVLDKLQVADVLKALFGACVATLVWGGVLLAVVVHKAVSRDSQQCSRIIGNLRDLQSPKRRGEKRK